MALRPAFFGARPAVLLPLCSLARWSRFVHSYQASYALAHADLFQDYVVSASDAESCCTQCWLHPGAGGSMALAVALKLMLGHTACGAGSSAGCQGAPACPPPALRCHVPPAAADCGAWTWTEPSTCDEWLRNTTGCCYLKYPNGEWPEGWERAVGCSAAVSSSSGSGWAGRQPPVPACTPNCAGLAACAPWCPP